MSEITLFRGDNHSNILLQNLGTSGLAVQANHHLIVHNGECLLLDPGGHAVFQRLFENTASLSGGAQIKHIFLSHQDPDIVSGINDWLKATSALAYVSLLWLRFVPHVEIDEENEHRLRAIPDDGMWINLNGAELALIPAHFLHSAGNFHLYDPTSKILYTGDIGASLGCEYREVTDFDEHVPFMVGFHKRYMASSVAMKTWVRLVRTLDIEVIAPQHGALFRGREMVTKFLSWCETLRCGVDRLPLSYELPPRPL